MVKQPKAMLRVGRGMYAVTIQQPQAAAVLARPGPCAHPSWKTDYRGPLLIHSAPRGGRRPGRSGGAVAGERAAGPAADPDYGALLGVVDLVDCVAHDREGGDPDEVGYVWVLANPRVFACPVPHCGRLGLFLVSDAVIAGLPTGAKAAKQRAAETPRRRPKKEA